MYILCPINETPMKMCKFNGILIDAGCCKNSGNYFQRKFSRIQQSVWNLASMKNAFERETSSQWSISDV